MVAVASFNVKKHPDKGKEKLVEDDAFYEEPEENVIDIHDEPVKDEDAVKKYEKNASKYWKKGSRNGS